MYPQDFKQNLLKGVVGEFQDLLTLATYSKKTMLAFCSPGPSPQRRVPDGFLKIHKAKFQKGRTMMAG